MKTSILFLFCLASICTAFAQSATKPFIEVRGMAKLERSIKSYKLDIVINQDQSYTDNKRTLDEVRNGFFEKAKSVGIDPTRFKEDKIAYVLTQYGAGGSYYTFETTKPEELIAIHSLMEDKSGTVLLIAKRIVYNPVTNFSKTMTDAFNDGKGRAEKIAAAMGKNLGELQSVIDYSNADDEEESVGYFQTEEDSYYYVSLKYAIE
ncbi:hypothetical protein [Sphingobacterium hungaricum]|uniref:DUF541 domain-containing protein n=1 Tax=Sphingobacterium hungaricum TaxID=2082723 RepID=A0A928UXB2_9SPHI|nr:hypothetical protein [Sphingobacterium hungaricum]MBE8714412.1 hypothetical protein [Sphingobacterium hungaricum]